MRRRHHTPQPVQAHCRLCTRLFAYFKTTKPRMYCAPCVEIKATWETAMQNNFVSQQRQARRLNARHQGG
jgi:hypothetical protein